jgi:hypothetical protein
MTGAGSAMKTETYAVPGDAQFVALIFFLYDVDMTYNDKSL